MNLPTLEQLEEKMRTNVFRLDGEFPHAVDYDDGKLHFIWDEVEGDTCEAEVDAVKSFDPKTNTYTLQDAADEDNTFALIFYQPHNPFAEQ